MTWQTGQATNYLDLVDDLIEVATNSHVDSMAINAGGTGYAVGDIEAIDGGTTVGGHTAAVEVLAVSAGVVTSVRISRGGSYTANPGTGATTSNEGTVVDPGTPGSGSGLTIDTTIAATGWSTLRDITDFGLSAVALVSGGSATYSVNDILTLVGGTGTAATVRVLTESAGVVTSIAVETPGEYTVKPTGTLSTTGGGGSGCTVLGTFVGEIGRRQVILQGVGSGADEVYVGLFAFNNSGTDAHNWELAGMTGHAAALEWQNQPGISFGRYSDQTTVFNGSYILLANTTMNWWISVTGRTIKVFANPGTTYSSCYLGWLDPLATEQELPNPLYIAGQTDQETERFSSSALYNSSIADPIAQGVISNPAFKGPGQFRDSAGVWNTVANSEGTSPRNARRVAVIYPAGQNVGTTPAQAPVDPADQIVDNGIVHWQAVIPNTGNPGTQTARLKPSPNSAGNLALPWPCTLVMSKTDSSVLAAIGELAGVFWVSAEEAMVAEDTMLDANDPQVRYRVFQSGSRADIFAHFCVRED